MANVELMPSGNYRIRVYSHTDDKGKKIYQSFSGPDKHRVELEAAKFKNSIDRRRSADITLEEALNNYITANKGSLSATTLKGYTYDAKRLGYFGKMKIRKIGSIDLQNFISYLSNEKGYSPKTVKNTYCTILVALDAADVDTDFKVNLPKKGKNRRKAPENEIVIRLLQEANPIMKRAIILAGLHSLRRSEICGLTYGDVEGNVIHVHSARVEGLEGVVHQDLTKTYESDRDIYLSDWEMKIIGKGFSTQYIVPIAPGTVTDNFKRLTDKLHIENCTLHTLRAYFASSAIRAGLQSIYAKQMGGWTENSAAFDQVYNREFESEEIRSREMLKDYFYENIKKKAL